MIDVCSLECMSQKERCVFSWVWRVDGRHCKFEKGDCGEVHWLPKSFEVQSFAVLTGPKIDIQEKPCIHLECQHVSVVSQESIYDQFLNGSWRRSQVPDKCNHHQHVDHWKTHHKWKGLIQERREYRNQRLVSCYVQSHPKTEIWIVQHRIVHFLEKWCTHSLSWRIRCSFFKWWEFKQWSLDSKSPKFSFVKDITDEMETYQH